MSVTTEPVRMIDDQFEDCDTTDLRACVARGAELLDEKIPGWAEKVRGSIVKGLFAMNAWETCVVGQLELMTYRPVIGSDFERNVIAFNGTAIRTYADGDKAVCALGFDVDTDIFPAYSGEQRQAYDDLQTYWTEEVANRTNITTA